MFFKLALRKLRKSVLTTTSLVLHVLLAQFVTAISFLLMVIGVSSLMVNWNSSNVRMVFVALDKLYPALPTTRALLEEVVSCAVPVPLVIHKASLAMVVC